VDKKEFQGVAEGVEPFRTPTAFYRQLYTHQNNEKGKLSVMPVCKT